MQNSNILSKSDIVQKIQVCFKFLIVSLICMLILPTAFAQRPQPEAKVIAVYFYANWCGNCKVLSPKLEEAKKTGNLNDKDVLFVTLDLSDKSSIHQTLLLAKSLGIGEYLREQGSATGYVALLDSKSKKEIHRFDRNSEPSDIVKVISDKL